MQRHRTRTWRTWRTWSEQNLWIEGKINVRRPNSIFLYCLWVTICRRQAKNSKCNTRNTSVLRSSVVTRGRWKAFPWWFVSNYIITVDCSRDLSFSPPSHGCRAESKVNYLHCIDLQRKKFTPVTSFACLEICSVLGHFSFSSNLAIRRLCCFLWSEDSEAKLMACQSPVLLNVKSSCYFTVIIFRLLWIVLAYAQLFFRICHVHKIWTNAIVYIYQLHNSWIFGVSL